MAFRFSFGDGEEQVGADDGEGAIAAPNAMKASVPPVREHPMTELVGKNRFLRFFSSNKGSEGDSNASVVCDTLISVFKKKVTSYNGRNCWK
jgi:hypothetical protein